MPFLTEQIYIISGDAIISLGEQPALLGADTLTGLARFAGPARFTVLARLLKQSYINFALQLHGSRASPLCREIACCKQASPLCRDENSHAIAFHPVKPGQLHKWEKIAVKV